MAFSKYLRPSIVYLALAKSIMAVMGAKSSFDLFLGKKYKTLINEGKEDAATSLKDQYQEDFNQKVLC